MKFTKIDRDNYVLNNYKRKTNAQLAEVTGWSVTTIKSSLTRQGLSRQGKTKRTLEIEKYILNNKEKADIEISKELGCKIDKVRDIKKSLGVFKSPSDIAFENLQKKYMDFVLKREDYIDCKTKMKLKCKSCGALMYYRPNELTTYKKECIKCLNGNCYIYLMKLEENIFKVGISNDPERRRKEVANSGHLVGLTLERTWGTKEGYSAAREIEGRVLANHERVFGTSGIFSGSTEFIYGDFGQLCEEISSLI